MAGKVISKANAAHIQSAHDAMTKLGAQCGGAAKRLALKAVGGGAFELIDKARDAMYRSVSLAESQDYESYPHLEDIYPDDGYAIIEIGDIYWKAPYTVGQDGAVMFAARDQWVQVVEVWQPVTQAMKAGALAATEADAPVYALKALGDRTIELRVAWGRDNHREAFDPHRTDFDLENFPSPPVLYYHGYKADNKPAPKPIIIGRTLARENRVDGHYITAKLNSKPEADKVLAAAATGQAFVSPGTIGHLIRKDADGVLTYWPIAEISAWDGAPTRKQAHPQSLAFLKSLYTEAGIPIPSVLDAPEAPGEGASAPVPDIDPETAGQVIAAEVAKALLTLRTKEQTK